MSETQGFEALQSLSSNPESAPREPVIDQYGRAYATGKRKNAVARVLIKPGKGVITINLWHRLNPFDASFTNLLR